MIINGSKNTVVCSSSTVYLSPTQLIDDSTSRIRIMSLHPGFYMLSTHLVLKKVRQMTVMIR